MVDPKTKIVSRLKFLKSNPIENYFKNDKIYVFHHIPKCGGTSLVYSLREWVSIVKDYKTTHLSKVISKPVRIERLRNFQCLSGHFHIPGIYLDERYPQVWDDPRYHVITMLRDPLQAKISLYYYERKINMHSREMSLEERLFDEPNWIASRFPCTEKNYKEVLDRYFFIGILEYAQESMNTLALLMNKKSVKIRSDNQTTRDHQASKLSREIISEFKKKNELDYLIYQYGLEKFNQLKKV